jgi:hypothetical protein
MMKVIGINSILNNEEEIEQDINIRNFNNIEDKCKVLHAYTNQKTNLSTSIIEVTPSIYKSIRENKNRLFVGYQNCRVIDVINTNPCSNCCRFGHSGNKCRNQTTCSTCAENHPAVQCKNQNLKCPNCDYSNINYKTNYNTNHNALDSEQCTILKNKINKYIASTDYPLEPIYQRYFGKVERPRSQPKVTANRRLASTRGNGSTLSPSYTTQTFLQPNRKSKS